jgi:hypothetical protein
MVVAVTATMQVAAFSERASRTRDQELVETVLEAYWLRRLSRDLSQPKWRGSKRGEGSA